MIKRLSFGICVLGDAACEATEHMIPCYQNLDRLKPMCDNFNHCASQCRIRIEMAFGMMQMKWGILQRPLASNLMNVHWQIQMIGCLHNFCIDQRLKEERDERIQVAEECASVLYLPSEPLDEGAIPLQLEHSMDVNTYIDTVRLREIMAQHVEDVRVVPSCG
jgi:hypothetical protein